MSDQSIGNFAERGLNGFFIPSHSLRAPRLGELDLRADLIRGEHRLRYLGRQIPSAAGGAEQARQGSACPAKHAAQGQLWKVSSLGNSDLRVGGDEVLLRRVDIRTALQEGGGQPRRNRGNDVLLRKRSSARDLARGFSQQQADLVLRLLDIL